MERLVGLHIRYNYSILDAFQQADELSLPFFQCFLIAQATNRYITLTESIIRTSLTLQEKYRQELYIHGSYWINIASPTQKNACSLLRKEINLARLLGATNFILHPGSATGCLHRKDGIIHIAHTLNHVLRHEPTMTILLENTAHGNSTIGSDITDFAEIKKYLDYPERVKYCIDTAHAFAYGYNIADPSGQQKFIELVQEVVNWENVLLLHLNDSQEEVGSRKDKHELLGLGKIGNDHLRTFVTHSLIRDKSLMLELPITTLEEQKKIIEMVKGWR